MRSCRRWWLRVEVGSVEAGGSVLQEEWCGGRDSCEGEWDEVGAEVWFGPEAQGVRTREIKAEVGARAMSPMVYWYTKQQIPPLRYGMKNKK